MTPEERIIAQKELYNKLKWLELFDTADDYAIEFAEWIETSEWNIKYWLHNNNAKELLEIFKKEKGL